MRNETGYMSAEAFEAFLSDTSIESAIRVYTLLEVPRVEPLRADGSMPDGRTPPAPAHE